MFPVDGMRRGLRGGNRALRRGQRVAAFVLAAGSGLKCGLVGNVAMHFSHATGMRGGRRKRLERGRKETQQHRKQRELGRQATHVQL
jgi:hypothetical protein